MRKLLILVTLVTLPTVARAASKGGVSLPDAVKVGGRSLVLNGLGIREATIFKVDVYVGGLYLPKRSKDAEAIIGLEAPKQIIMHFVRDVEAEKIAQTFQSGFEQNAGKRFAKMKDRFQMLEAASVDMKVGDRLVLTYEPGKGSTISANGKTAGPIPGADFARVLFTIFIGPNPPNQGLKDGLLGID